MNFTTASRSFLSNKPQTHARLDEHEESVEDDGQDENAVQRLCWCAMMMVMMMFHTDKFDIGGKNKENDFCQSSSLLVKNGDSDHK